MQALRLAVLSIAAGLAAAAGDDEAVLLQVGSRQKAMRGGPIVQAPCARLDAPDGTPEERALMGGLQEFCRSPAAEVLEAEIVPGFEANYHRWYDERGWTDEAYVNYFSSRGDPWQNFNLETELLIESVHRFSRAPIVAYNFGHAPAPANWTAERFPRLVLFNFTHGMPLGDKHINFNKIRGMILAQARAGVVVDSDMFVWNGDKLFDRTREEVNEAYPYPILPAHWMSREVADDANVNEGASYYNLAYGFKCPGCPKRTQRWNHAHPTWTYHALPFIGRLLGGAITEPRRVLDLSPEVSKSVPEGEDEVLMNVGLWAAGASKQWCKWDVPYPDEFEKYVTGNGEGLKGCCKFQDDKWFPHGVPIAFYISHGAKKPETETKLWLDRLSALPSKDHLPDIAFNGTFYKTKEEMYQHLGKRLVSVGTDGTSPDMPKCLL